MINRPSWVPSTIHKVSTAAFVLAAKKALREGKTSCEFQGKTYHLKKKVINEALVAPSGRYAFGGVFKIIGRYNDSGYSDPGDWLNLVRNYINSDIPDGAIKVEWKDINPDDTSSITDNSLAADIERLSAEGYLEQDTSPVTWIIPDDSDTENTLKAVKRYAKENDLKFSYREADDDDFASYVWSQYFDDGTHGIDEAIRLTPVSDYDDFDTSELEDHIQELEKDFTDSKLERYLKVDGVKSASIHFETARGRYTYVITVDTESVLSDEDVETLRKSLVGQMSDGWGEGAEQQETDVQLENDLVDLEFNFSDHANKLKLVSFTKTDSDLKKFVATAFKKISAVIPDSAKNLVSKSKKKVAGALARTAKKLAEAASPKFPLDVTIKTAGDGLWSDESRDVKVTGIRIRDDFVDVFFDTSTWNNDKHGLIYTDTKFLKGIKAHLKSLGANSDLSYTEQGLQGRNYVSMEYTSNKYPKFAEVLSKPITESAQNGALDTSETNLLFKKLSRFGSLKDNDLKKLLSQLRLYKEGRQAAVNRVLAITLLIDILDELASDRITLRRLAANPTNRADVVAAAALNYSSNRANEKAVIDAAVAEGVAAGLTAEEINDSILKAKAGTPMSALQAVKVDKKLFDRVNKVLADIK